MKKTVTFLVLAALAACSAPPERGEFVPIRQLLAENADTPFECVGYQSTTDSCEGIGRGALRGNSLVSTTFFALDMGQPVQVRTVTRHHLRDGKACGIIGEAKVSVTGAQSAEAEQAISQMFSAMMTGVISELCIGYYRSGTGYFVETTTLDGTPVDEMTEDNVSRFFAAQKKLRNLEM